MCGSSAIARLIWRKEAPWAPEELGRLLETVLQEFGCQPVAISLPQQISISQVIDLPPVGPEQVKALIEEETVKLSGLSESGIVYDYGRLKPFGKYRNPFWVTFAKEEEILTEVSRLAGMGAHLCEIITPANALIATYQAAQPRPENALLVELGAASTVVAIVAQGQGVYAISIPVGGNMFTEVIAQQKNCSLESAKSLKYSQNLLAGGQVIPELCATVDGWRSELEKILQDWLRENPELGLSSDSFRIILGGGGARQPGLMEHLNARSALRFTSWPSLSGELGELTLDRYAVAYGVALKRLGSSPPSASLFPADLREARKTATHPGTASFDQLGLAHNRHLGVAVRHGAEIQPGAQKERALEAIAGSVGGGKRSRNIKSTIGRCLRAAAPRREATETNCR